MDTPAAGRTVFEYENYRAFLKDWFAEQKAKRATFSHRYFAQRAGFASSSFCSHVMEGHKNLSVESIGKMAKGLSLSGRAAQYFEALVLCNQAQTLADREEYRLRLSRLRRSSQLYKVNKHQFSFYDQWYFPVIRELAVYADWHDDYVTLAGMVIPSITAEEARSAVESLISLGLLIRSEEGSLQQSAATISAENVPPVLYRSMKKTFLVRGLEAADRFSSPQLHHSSVTLSYTQAGYERARALIDTLRRDLLTLAEEDNGAERVYQANLQLFPLTESFVQVSPTAPPPGDQP